MHSANREAVACFEQTLTALQHLQESRTTIEQAIDLRLTLRMALHQLGEFEQGLEHVRAAETLAEALHDQRRLGHVSASITSCFYTLGDLDRALASGQRTLAIAVTLDDFRLRVETNFYLGQVYYQLGDYRQAIDLLRRNVAFLQGDLSRSASVYPVPLLPSPVPGWYGA